MAKKHLPAAQKQKISEGVKRARAARLAKSSTTAKIEPFRVVERVTLTPRSSKDEAAQLAADLVDLVGDEMPALAVVRMVERILRP